MKKIIYVLLFLVILVGGLLLYINVNSNKNTEGVSYTEITETDDGYVTNMVIEKGEYQIGDVVYLTYTSESNETVLSDLIITNVFALEDEDVIAYHEVNEEEVNTLKENDLNVYVELALTDEDVNAIGAQNLSKHVRANKVSNNNEEQKLQIKNKYQEKETEYIRYKTQKGNTETENGNGSSNNSSSDNGQQNGV